MPWLLRVEAGAFAADILELGHDVISEDTANLAYGILVWKYPSIPDEVRIHVSSTDGRGGGVDEMAGSSSTLIERPAIQLTDQTYRHERLQHLKDIKTIWRRKQVSVA